eukprot:g18286.t1
MPTAEDSIAGKPLQRFKRLAGSLETLISSIAQDWEAAAIDTRGDSVIDDDCPTKPIHGKIRKAQLLFTELHSTTRKMHGAIETIRSKVATAKQSMDLNHLQLENLLYERDHLSRETQLCRDFTMSELSKMEEAEEQGFLEDVDTLQTPEEHTRNLAILKEQKEKRTSAQLELRAVQMKVKAATSSLNETKGYLERLPNQLNDVMQAIEPLKGDMKWRPGSRRGRAENATDLPGPLFTLFCQLEAYCDSVLAETGSQDESGAASSSVAFGGGERGNQQVGAVVSVSLVPAKVHVSASAKAAAEEPEEVSPAAARVPGAAKGNDADATSEPEGKRKRRHYDQDQGNGDGKRKVSRREVGRATLEALKPSPTEVLLTINRDYLWGDVATTTTKSRGGRSSSRSSISSNNNNNAFSVRFSFLPALGIVAVCPPPGAPKGILANLFPNDTGKDTPNPANHHGKAARVSPLGIFQYPADVPCRPYRWAQWMAGLHFPPPAASTVSSAGAESPIEPSVRSAMAALRSRVRTSAALDGQLRGLGDGKGASPLAGMESELPEVTGTVELSSWKELSGTELQQAAVAFQERDAFKSGSSVQGEEAVSELSSASPPSRDAWERFGARYFKGTVKTKKTSDGGPERTVHIQVEVPAEYPLRPSLVSLAEDKPSLSAEGEAAVKEELCTIANEVNAHYDTLLTEDVSRWDHLLSHQLVLVMGCLGTKGSTQGALGRLRRGRMRRKPVVFARLERKFVHR